VAAPAQSAWPPSKRRKAQLSWSSPDTAPARNAVKSAASVRKAARARADPNRVATAPAATPNDKGIHSNTALLPVRSALPTTERKLKRRRGHCNTVLDSVESSCTYSVRTGRAQRARVLDREQPSELRPHPHRRGPHPHHRQRIRIVRRTPRFAWSGLRCRREVDVRKVDHARGAGSVLALDLGKRVSTTSRQSGLQLDTFRRRRETAFRCRTGIAPGGFEPPTSRL
jgi:hypothetical protein